CRSPVTFSSSSSSARADRLQLRLIACANPDAISRLPGTFGSGQSLIHSSSARTQPPRGPDAASIKTEREYRMAHGSTDALRLEREGEAGVRNGAGAEPDLR